MECEVVIAEVGYLSLAEFERKVAWELDFLYS